MLASHRKSHSTIHPYRCLDCSNSFKHRNQLKTHQAAKNHARGSVLNPDGSLPAREITAATLAQLRRQREKQLQRKQQQQQRDTGSVSVELLDRVQEFLQSRSGIDGGEPECRRRKRTFVRRRRSQKISSAAVGSESTASAVPRHTLSSNDDGVLNSFGLFRPVDNSCSLASTNMDPLDDDCLRFGGSSVQESPARFPIGERVHPPSHPFQIFPRLRNSYVGYDSATAMRAAHESLVALQQQFIHPSTIQQCLALHRAANLQSQMLLSLRGSTLNSLPPGAPEMPAAFATNSSPLMFGVPGFWTASSENRAKTIIEGDAVLSELSNFKNKKGGKLKKRRSPKSRSERDRNIVIPFSESQGSAAELTEPLDLKIKHKEPSDEQTEFLDEAGLCYANQYEEEKTVTTFDTTENATAGKEVTEMCKDAWAETASTSEKVGLGQNIDIHLNEAISTSAMRVDGYGNECVDVLDLSKPGTDLPVPNRFQETGRPYAKSRNINSICERLKERRLSFAGENSNRLISKWGSSVLDLSVKRTPKLFRYSDSILTDLSLGGTTSTQEISIRTSPDQSDSTVVDVVDVSDDYFECCHCKIAFKDERMYAYHVGYHSENNAFMCARCGAERRTAVDFCRHIMTAAHP